MKPLLLSWGSFQLFAYPLLMGIAWGLAYRLSDYFRVRLQIQIKSFPILFWGALVLSWIGAKLMFLLVSGGELQATYLSSGNFWLGGGFVFYGGLILGAAWLVFLGLGLKHFELKQLYFILPALTLGHAIGRVGCFLAGCCYGTQCNLAWAVKMHGHMLHPVQLYESALLLMVSLVLWKLVVAKNITYAWLTYLGGYGAIRFITEEYRGDIVRGFYGPLSTSQWVSVAMMIIAITLAVRSRKEL
ncbi:MAG: hypothetical protein CME71_07555 [Halobacteriovorax sp.]|nr:hypothetical protein [Halobacteriovorax sp.]